MIKRLAIGFVFTLLAGCGFHLRGFADRPSWLTSVAIIVQGAHRDLGPMLKDQLDAYNIRVYPHARQADYLLIIESDGIQQQITNVGASTAPRQYLLIYDVQFTVIKSKGGVVLPSTHVAVTRQLTVNNDRILGSNSEETLLSREMREDAALQIMNRLSRENKHLR